MENSQKRSLWLNSTLASLDLNGTTFQLGFPSKNGKFQTKCGGYLSLAISLSTMIAFVFLISQLFTNHSPVVNITPEFNPHLTEINIYEQDLIIPLMFKRGKKLISSSKELSRYFTVKMNALYFDFDKNTGRWSLDIPAGFYYVPCDDIRSKSSRIASLVDKLFIYNANLKKYLFSPDLKDKASLLTLSRTEGTRKIQNANIRVHPCSLEDPESNCAKIEEIEQTEVIFFSNNKILDASNFNDPVKYSPKKLKLKVDTSKYKDLKYYAELNYILDDSSQLSAPKRGESFAVINLEGDDKRKRSKQKITCTADELKAGHFTPCTPYINLNYYMRSDLTKNRRSYKKASVVLGEFGGFLKLISTLVILFYSFYGAQMKLYLVKETFFKGKEKKVENKLNQSINKDLINVKNGVKTPKNNKNQSGAALGCLESISGTKSFMKKMSLIEIFEKRLLEEDDSKTIGKFILEKKIEEYLKRRKKDQDFRTNLNKSRNFMYFENYEDKPSGERSSYLKAFNYIKKAQLKRESKFQAVLDAYIIENLEGIFEAED